jgi:PAS domain-containing protein
MAGETALRASVPALTETPVVAARLAAATVAAVLGTHAWRGRGSRGAVPLAALLFGVALWTGASALSTLAPGRAGTVFWYHTASVGAVTAVTAWALFVLEYAGFEDLLGPRAYTALAVEPLVVLVFVFTNGSHGLFWSAYRFDAAAATVAPVPGPAFRAHVAYVYGMVLISWGVLFATLASRRRTLARGQVLTLGGAMVAPVLASTAWLPVRHPDPTPYGFLVAGGLLSVAVFRYRLSSVTPVARDAVVERMRAAVVVLDGDDRVVDRNAAAERLFGLFGDDVGRPAAEAFASVPAVAEWFREGADAAEIDLDPPAGDRSRR